MASLAVQEVNPNVAATVTMTAATSSVEVTASEDVVLLIATLGTGCTVTLSSVPEPNFNRSGDIAKVCGTNGIFTFGQLKRLGFMQTAGGNAGKFVFAFSATTNITVAAIRYKFN